MIVTEEIVRAAMQKAAEGHSDKKEVGVMMANADTYAKSIVASIKSGDYKHKLRYRKLKKQNPNGKVRNINSPMLFTFVIR